ncbi:MAG: hypothetical protein IPP27_16130 [Bacteroidetes bacterium]|nr:hypothetical protein [Bacteroidota bacterium]
MNTSVANGILHKVKSKEPGTILFPNDFKEFGGDDAIKTALSRFNKEGLIRRLARNLCKTKYDPEQEFFN